jgi:hypothetical protein
VSTLTSSDLRRAVALLEAGDWQTAHRIVQQDEESPLPCWAHGIVHVMEGDISNARYWYGQANRSFPERYSVADEIVALKTSASA